MKLNVKILEQNYFANIEWQLHWIVPEHRNYSICLVCVCMYLCWYTNSILLETIGMDVWSFQMHNFRNKLFVQNNIQHIDDDLKFNMNLSKIGFKYSDIRTFVAPLKYNLCIKQTKCASKRQNKISSFKMLIYMKGYSLHFDFSSIVISS